MISRKKIFVVILAGLFWFSGGFAMGAESSPALILIAIGFCLIGSTLGALLTIEPRVVFSYPEQRTW